MSLNMNECEFRDKYAFSIHDFYYSCIDDILRKSYWCCSVSELAYDIAKKIHNEIDADKIEENEILYKLSEDIVWKNKIYTHNVAIHFKDIFFCFEIGWTGNCLSVKDWDIKSEEEILNDKEYTDIDKLEDQEEVEV